jgi:serine phosphatase RsbU (regulator of sigma subunit)
MTDMPPLILIVDDNRLNRELLRLHLKKHGYNFLSAGNGLEAIEAITSHGSGQSVDLILLDLMMPEMDGFEFLVWRKGHEDMLEIPVIVNSSLDDFESIAKALTMDTYDYFTKPLHHYDLEIILPLKIKNAINAKRSFTTLRHQNVVMRNELAMAARYQQFLLPAGVDMPNAKVSYMFQPCSDVGGDYFDFWSLDNGCLCFVLTDATGHGVSAAMTASIVKALLPAYLKSNLSPARALLALNGDLLRLTQEDTFVTAASILYDPRHSRISWCLAGHPYPVFVPKGEAPRTLVMDSFFLGIFPSDNTLMDIHDQILPINPGDRIVIYSDGLTEAPGAETGNGFGVERLMEIMDSNRDQTIDQLRDFIHERLKEYVKGDFPDDVAYIIMEF